MKINCASCGYEINLDHHVFRDYEGSVKCFCCGSMMDVKSREGVPYSVDLLSTLAQASPEHPREMDRPLP